MKHIKSNIKIFLLRVVRSKKVQKFTISIFMVLVLFVVSFYSFSLVKFYDLNVKKKNDVKLVYTFKPLTFAKYSDSLIANNDISEMFLSYGVSYGIDVSEWQGDINWSKVASTGISFAIIRCGFREIDGSRIFEDANFRKNIKEAKEAGLNVGVYFFGTARNEDEAREEAEFTINLVKDYQLSYPIVYDAEVFDRGRLENVSYSQITDNILAFSDTIESYGYASMIYSYRNSFVNNLDTGKFDGKLIWLAHYVDKTDYKGNYSMWQYSEEGNVAGISGNVDLNVSYFTYVENENDIKSNPDYISAPKVNFTDVDETVVSKANAIIRNSPSLTIPNKIGSLSYGVSMKRIGTSDKISKVLYNDRVVYFANSDLRVIS